MRNLIKTSIAILFAMMLFLCVDVSVDVQAKAISLNKKSLTLEVGKTSTLKVKGTKKSVTWTSTNKSVATVTKKGKVTAKKAGTATICARVAKKKLKCKVTVKAAKVPQKAALTEYWPSDSIPAKELREYVEKVTDDKSPDFIPKKSRIAVFDMDGTLTCETFFTYYDTMMFIEFCLKDHPERVSDELKKAAASIRPGYLAGEELARNFAKAYAGMSIRELFDYAVEFGQKKTASFNNMRYLDGFYLPMVEVVRYLYENDFTIYVVSGTELTTTRAIVANSPIKDYVTPDHVIGTEFEVKLKGCETISSNMDYKYKNGDELVITGGFIQKNLHANKVIFIEREIGQQPVLAFGNSGSDTSMLNYTLDSRNPYISKAFMVVADDREREWGPQDWAEKSAEYKSMGYIPISMKNDFLMIYPEGITKNSVQYQETEPASESEGEEINNIGELTYKRAA